MGAEALEGMGGAVGHLRVVAPLNVHFSSVRLNWRTPKALYDELDAEFGFNFDPCPAVGPDFWRVDGLASEWGSVTFCNPPYGSQIGIWVRKAYQEAQRGCTVVLLVPSRTDTAWWHDYVMQATEIRFIRGRLHFDEHPNPAPFPSAVVNLRSHRTLGACFLP